VAMTLLSLLQEKKSALTKGWTDIVIGSYPEEAQRFFRKEKNRFSNPVGQTIAQEISTLVDEIITPSSSEKVSGCLDNIIRIRAIQDFSASEAVAFVLQLKKVIRGVLRGGPLSNGSFEELRNLEDQIDDMALLAFDIYTKHRQRLYELRVDEVKRQVSRLLVRANLVCEIPDVEPEL
jgi:hypothetical protein